MPTRRAILATGSVASLAAMVGKPLSALAETIALPFANGERPMVTVPGKRPLIGLTVRPPQLETPFEVFNEGILTPNDAFFVRYHLSDIPTEIDLATYRVEIAGHVETPVSLTLDDIKAIADPVEIVAVNQCSGNSRGFVEPRVGGGQLGNGAMGNARWTGVPLKAVLERARVKHGAVQASFDGLDKPPLPGTPDFVKALDIKHAMDGEVMLAWAMNGEELPWLNGYPLRLVVPGWYGTYWVKHLSRIDVLDKTFDGFWMASAYRIPDNATASVEPGTKPSKTVPINRFNVRSFLTNTLDGAAIKAGKTDLRGIAFDGGSGIAAVSVSIDEGKTWQQAKLGDELSKYSFREWTATVDIPAGKQSILVRAKANSGEEQPMKPRWNPAGYMRNVVETTRITAA